MCFYPLRFYIILLFNVYFKDKKYCKKPFINEYIFNKKYLFFISILSLIDI